MKFVSQGYILNYILWQKNGNFFFIYVSEYNSSVNRNSKWEGVLWLCHMSVGLIASNSLQILSQETLLAHLYTQNGRIFTPGLYRCVAFCTFILYIINSPQDWKNWSLW